MAFFHSTEFRRYFSNTSWLLAERVVRMVVQFAVLIYVARYLGPDRFGLLNYAASLVALLSALVTLGLDGIAVRELVRSPHAEHTLLGTVFWLSMMTAAMLFLTVSGVVWALPNESEARFLVVIIAFSYFAQPFRVIDYYFQSKVLARYTVYAQFFALLLTSVAKLLAVYLEASLSWFGLILLAEFVIQAIGLMLFYIRRGGTPGEWHFRWAQATGLLRDSWPLILSTLSVLIYMRIDQVMLKQMVGNSAVGIYVAAVTISEVWYFVPVVVSASLFPAIIDAKHQGKEIYERRLQRLYDLLAMVALVAAAITTLVAEPLVRAIYGSAYESAGTILAIHVWAGLNVFLGVVRGKWLLVENLQRYELALHAVGAFLNVALNLVLIPHYGAIGAAVATLASYFGATMITPIFLPRIRRSLYMILRAYLHTATGQPIREYLQETREAA